MREVIAVIRPNKVAATKRALVEAGIPALTGMRCAGRGRHDVNFSLPDEASPTVQQGGGLLPKYLLDIAVPKDLVPRIVEIITLANHTGTPGDGKIFVLPMTDAVRMRTGEKGKNALDEMHP